MDGTYNLDRSVAVCTDTDKIVSKFECSDVTQIFSNTRSTWSIVTYMQLLTQKKMIEAWNTLLS